MPKSVVVAVRDIPRITNQLKIEKMELKFKAQRKHNSENVYFNLKYFLENDEATIPDAFLTLKVQVSKQKQQEL